jgi:hypothetical protein
MRALFRSRRRVILWSFLVLVCLAGVLWGPSWWQQFRDARIVAEGGQVTATVLAVEAADEDNPGAGRWRYTLLVTPPEGLAYRATTEIAGFLVPGDTVVNVAVDPENPEQVVIIP